MIIGISGKMGAGKDEFAGIAVKEFGATRVAFADAVKEEVAEYLTNASIPFRRENLYGTQAEKEELIDPKFNTAEFLGGVATYRQLLQWWGTEYRRAQDENYWVKQALAKCQGPGLYVIPDVRFKNEAQGIFDCGGALIRINRHADTGSHSSETDLDDWAVWDAIYDNTGSLEEFHDFARRVMRIYDTERLRTEAKEVFARVVAGAK